MVARRNDPIKALLAETASIEDPETRAQSTTELLMSLASAESEAKVIRRMALTELVAQGWTYDEIGEMIGVKKARVYQILNGMSGGTSKYLGK